MKTIANLLCQRKLSSLLKNFEQLKVNFQIKNDANIIIIVIVVIFLFCLHYLHHFLFKVQLCGFVSYRKIQYNQQKNILFPASAFTESKMYE